MTPPQSTRLRIASFTLAILTISIISCSLRNSNASGSSILYDDFSGNAYKLTLDNISPNGKWSMLRDGSGTAGTKDIDDGKKAFFEQPRRSGTSRESYSVLVMSTSKYENITLSLDMNTAKQLRQSPLPKAWETAWIFFNYVDNAHYYYFVLKTSGAELGKVDDGRTTYLKTISFPKVTIGKWQHIDISKSGRHITVDVGGTNIIDFNDITQSRALAKEGALGLGSNNALAYFRNIFLNKPHTTSLAAATQYDDFSGLSYSLRAGQISPNGLWRDVYDGHGSGTAFVGVKQETETGINRFYERPFPPTSLSESHASLAISTRQLADFSGSIDFRTDEQLRKNDPPNPWEVAWVFLKYVDETHHYYFNIRSNGWEFGKKDNLPGDSTVERQIYFLTESNPKLQIGRTYHLDWSIVGNHIMIWVDGMKWVDLIDDGSKGDVDPSTSSPSKKVNGQTALLSGPGSIGMYTENAEASFTNVYMTANG